MMAAVAAANRAFRVDVVGNDEDLARLRSSVAAAPDPFEMQLERPDPEGCLPPERLTGIRADVAVIGSSVEKPLPVARQLRMASPKSQILFLLRPDRLDRFRACLPFVPNLASAWTASTTADEPTLAAILTDAARTARRRAAADAVMGRINQQLARRSAQAPDVRSSQLALSERYLATILTQSPDAFLALATSGALIAYNDAAVALFGARVEAGEVSVAELFPEEEASRLTQLIGRAASGETLSQIEFPLGRGEDRPRYLELSVAPVHNEAGAIASVSVTARDISERKAGEERQRLLISELNHRVKNTLAIVQGLAQQSFKGERSSADERAAFASRLAALAAAHNLLTQKSWESVELADLAKSALEACGADESRLVIAGPRVVLPPQNAVSLAIAFHELCTNAIKYGALSTEVGCVEVRWTIEGHDADQRLLLQWIESGGPPVEAPTHRGFGLRMIERGLASELGGTVAVEFDRGGLVCRINSPLPGLGS